jgi:hypothetical protein
MVAPLGIETEVWGEHHWVHDPDNCWCSTDRSDPEFADPSADPEAGDE